MRGDGWYNFAGMKCRRHFQKTFQWRVLRPENSKNENGKGRAILGWTRNRHTRERIYEKCRMTDLKQKKNVVGGGRRMVWTKERSRVRRPQLKILKIS